MAAPHLELDSVFHQPGWEPLADEHFRARVAEFVAASRWVVDGNYSRVQDLVWQRADTVVWIDLPRRLVIRRIILRTLRRTVGRVELWNGNKEPWTNLFRADPAKSIIAWSWTRHRIYQERYARDAADPANEHLTFVRLRSPADAALLISRAGEHSDSARRPPGSGPPGRRSGPLRPDRARSRRYRN